MGTEVGAGAHVIFSYYVVQPDNIFSLVAFSCQAGKKLLFQEGYVKNIHNEDINFCIKVCGPGLRQGLEDGFCEQCLFFKTKY